MIFARDAEHIGDHRDGQGDSNVFHEVNAAATLFSLVHQAGGHLVDLRSQHFHASRGERLREK